MKNILKSKKVIIPVIILCSITLMYFLFMLYKEYKSGNIRAKENISEIKQLNEEDPSNDPPAESSNQSSTDLKDKEYYSIDNVYDILHRMSNSKIIAEDNEVWGSLSISPDNISAIKSLVKRVNYDDKDYLLEVLNRWENNDFSKVDDEHNYFWDKLDGTVGRAIGIKE